MKYKLEVYFKAIQGMQIFMMISLFSLKSKGGSLDLNIFCGNVH